METESLSSILMEKEIKMETNDANEIEYKTVKIFNVRKLKHGSTNFYPPLVECSEENMFKWKIYCDSNPEYLWFFHKVNSTHDNSNFEFKIKYRIINEIDANKDICQELHPPAGEENDVWEAQKSVMEYDEFLKEENGYVKDGKAKVEMIVTYTPIDKMVRKLYNAERKCSQYDCEIQTRSRQVNARSIFLAEKSTCFKEELEATLFGNKYFKKVDSPHSEVILFLELLCNCGRPFEDNTIGGILKLCVKYDCPVEIQQCEKYIIESTTIPMIQKLKYADTYKLNRLKTYCLYDIKLNNQQQELINTPGYSDLDVSIRLEISELERRNIERPEDYLIGGQVRKIKQPREWLTDTILVVNDVEFYVLAWESEVFDELLWNVKSKRDAEISNQSSGFFGNLFQLFQPNPVKLPPIKITIESSHPDDFDDFLQMIYQPTNPVTCSNFKYMLELSYRYKVWFIIGKCQQYLIVYPRMELIDKLIYAGKYELEKLIDHCLTQISTVEDVKALRATGRLGEMNGDIAKKILMKIE